MAVFNLWVLKLRLYSAVVDDRLVIASRKDIITDLLDASARDAGKTVASNKGNMELSVYRSAFKQLEETVNLGWQEELRHACQQNLPLAAILLKSLGLPPESMGQTVAGLRRPDTPYLSYHRSCPACSTGTDRRQQPAGRAGTPCLRLQRSAEWSVCRGEVAMEIMPALLGAFIGGTIWHFGGAVTGGIIGWLWGRVAELGTQQRVFRDELVLLRDRLADNSPMQQPAPKTAPAVETPLPQLDPLELSLRDMVIEPERMMAAEPLKEQQIRPLPALAGASVESGGKNALRPTIPAATWRKLLLWGALLSGVLLLARMAWKLSREMGLDAAQKNAPENEHPVVEKGGGEG